jgi:DNA-binding transcriptional regulator YhcF (GntR family)
MLLEIDGQKNIYKDSESGAVVTKRSGEYEEHKKRVAGQKRINTVINDVQYLKEEMSEIKQLLKDIKDGS